MLLDVEACTEARRAAPLPPRKLRLVPCKVTQRAVAGKSPPVPLTLAAMQEADPILFSWPELRAAAQVLATGGPCRLLRV
jgi:hypothetical protein